MAFPITAFRTYTFAQEFIRELPNDHITEMINVDTLGVFSRNLVHSEIPEEKGLAALLDQGDNHASQHPLHLK